jgi:hypothetical protein
VGDDEWPSDYYCDCCGRDEESDWDEDEDDFYCDNCEKYHDDDEEECCYYDEDDECTYCEDDDDEDDDEDNEGNAIATYHIDLTNFGPMANFTYFQGEDGATYLTAHCKSCRHPLHARIDVPSLDEFLANHFWQRQSPTQYGWDHPIHPREMFPSIEQVYSLPNPMPKSDFDKSDFDKSDFQKGDSQKSDFLKWSAGDRRKGGI